MNNNLTALATFYPVLPGSSLTPVEACLKDAVIYITAPACAPVITNSDKYIAAKITSLHVAAGAAISASVLCTAACYNNYSSTQVVPVYDVNTPVATTSSYIVADETKLRTLSGLSTLNLELHPNCIVLQQAAPIMTIQKKSLVGGTITGSAVLSGGAILSAANGFNTAATITGGTLTIAGALGAGSGTVSHDIYNQTPVTPWTPIPAGSGARSLNGASDAITVIGDGAVLVTTVNTPVTSAGATVSGGTIKLTIGRR